MFVFVRVYIVCAIKINEHFLVLRDLQLLVVRMSTVKLKFDDSLILNLRILKSCTSGFWNKGDIFYSSIFYNQYFIHYLRSWHVWENPLFLLKKIKLMWKERGLRCLNCTNVSCSQQFLKIHRSVMCVWIYLQFVMFLSDNVMECKRNK